ncbi:MAG TPA: hypothetical protein VNF47_23975 [Streptosporangiaceae bacterium]|nr:hypothetical protein [Streptosporangiaceae bacterium]
MTDDDAKTTDADPGALRLDVLAALVSCDTPASRAADSWVHPDGTRCSAADADLLDSATSDEWQVAEALRGEPGELSGPDASALAALLKLALGTAPATLLCVGLRQAFTLPDDSLPAPARAERTAAFADLYRRLALPGLGNDSKKRAAALLEVL